MAELLIIDELTPAFKLTGQRAAERQALIDKNGIETVKAAIGQKCRKCQSGLGAWGRCQYSLLPIDDAGNIGCQYFGLKAAGR